MTHHTPTNNHAGTTAQYDTAVSSRTIDFLRFPLCLAVIFIHTHADTVAPCTQEFSSNMVQHFWNTIYVLLSHVATHVAVPIFFLFSGLLFFKGMDTWNGRTYISKIKRRVSTLLVPFLLWNLLSFLLVCRPEFMTNMHNNSLAYAIQQVFSRFSWHIFVDATTWGHERVNWLGMHIPSTGPILIPLWFLRDLIAVSLIAPIIYLLVKKGNFLALFILLLAYVSKIWPLIPGFRIDAVFYFSLGSFLSIHHKGLSFLVCKRMYTITAMWLVLLVVDVYYGATMTLTGQLIHPWFVLTGVVFTISCAYNYQSTHPIRTPHVLSASSFFVYALHPIPLSLHHAYIYDRLPLSNEWAKGVNYILTPFVTAALCVGCYVVLKRCAPRLCSLLSGNR